VNIRLASKALQKARFARLVPLLLVGALFVSISPGVLADTLTTYEITFTLNPGATTLPASGSFTYDSTNPQFSNFLVSWGGVTFDLAPVANAPDVTGSGCTGEASTPSFGFTIISQSASGCSSPIGYYWAGLFEPGGFGEFAFGIYNSVSGFSEDFFTASLSGLGASEQAATGVFSITPTSTVITPEPEPSAFVLLWIGMFALLGIRRSLRLA
jgi:hypothetical protein